MTGQPGRDRGERPNTYSCFSKKVPDPGLLEVETVSLLVPENSSNTGAFRVSKQGTGV